MNTAVAILAAAGTVQSLAVTVAALVFGLRIASQLRISAPPKQPEAPKDGTAAETAGAENERALRPAS